MNIKEKTFTCQNLEHLKQPIDAFCLNLQCQEKTQCCIECLIKKHKGHQERDCKTIYQIQQMIDYDIVQMPFRVSQADKTFSEIKKVRDGLNKLFIAQRDKLLELKENMKNPNFYLQNQDFVRLRNLNTLIKKIYSQEYKEFFQGVLKAMMKIKQALQFFAQFKIKEIERIETAINLDQIIQQGKKIILQDTFLNNQITVYCNNEQCYENQQCCHLCAKKDNILMFQLLLPILEIQIQTLNQWVFIIQTYFVYGQYIYQTLSQVLEAQLILFQNMKYFLQAEEFFQFMLNLNNMKKWYRIKEINVKIKYQEIILDLIFKLISLPKSIIKQIEGDERQLKIQVKKNYIKMAQEICEKGNELEKSHCYGEAIICYDQAITLNPKAATAYQRKGFALMHLKRFQEAILSFDSAIKLDPKSFQTFSNKGLALSRLNRFEEAIISLNKAIQLEPNSCQSFNNKGHALNNLHRFEEAIIAFDQAIDLDPSNSQLFNNKGFALSNLNRDEEAIICVDQAIKLDPQNSSAYQCKGFALSNLNRDEDAIKCLDEAIKLDPLNYQAYQSKGSALSNLNRLEDAIKYFDKSIALDPSNSFTFNFKGIALRKLNRFEESIKCFDKSIKLNPSYSQAFNNKGFALRKLNRFEDAINCYDQAIKLDPSNLLAYQNKGSVLDSLNHYDDAIQCYYKAVKLDPSNSVIINRKKIVQKKQKHNYSSISHL